MECDESLSPEPEDNSSIISDSDSESYVEPTLVGEVTIDADGDAVICAELGHEEKRFIISSKAFSQVSERCSELYKDSITIDCQIATYPGKVIIEVKDDDWITLEMVLRIAHQQVDEVPAAMSLCELSMLAQFTNKYQATRIVRPWISGWLDKSWQPASISDNIQHAWIAWEFGLVEDFKDIMSILVMDADRLGDWNDDLQYNGSPLWEIMPPGTLESILSARSFVLTQLVRVADRYLRKCLSGNPCKLNHRACSASICGSYIYSLQFMQLYPVSSSDNIAASVRRFSIMMRTLEIYTPANAPRANHDTCNFAKAVAEDVKTILKTKMPSAVTEAHMEHLRRQEVLLDLPGLGSRRETARTDAERAGKAELIEFLIEKDLENGVPV